MNLLGMMQLPGWRWDAIALMVAVAARTELGCIWNYVSGAHFASATALIPFYLFSVC